MLRKSMETPNWFTMKEARSPRSVMEEDIVSEIRATREEILQIFEEKKEDPNKSRTNRSYGHNKNKPSYNLPAEPHIFQKKVQLGQEIPFNSSAILSEIVKVSLKAYVELIRLNTFGKTGHHQMQVDIYFLRVVLGKLIDEEYLSDNFNLLDEALVNVAERTIDPHKLEHSVKKNILNSLLMLIFFLKKNRY